MKKIINILGQIILVFIVSCGVSNDKIATIKNNSSGIVACLLLKNGIITDSLLYNDTTYMRYLIRPQKYDTYMGDSNLTKAPDIAKTYIYILNLDSLNKFRKSKLKGGILKHSLLKRIVVQLNKVREPVDTIYVK